MSGKILDGKYRLVRVLGAGGMGSVYEAEEVATDRTVAVKVIHAALTAHTQGDAFLSRFDREVRTAGAIDTDHIVRILDAGTDPETMSPYMVMEYLVGEDLDHLVRRLGPLPPDLAVRVVAQACIGLQKAHEARVVHRDIKPANLYLATKEGDERIVKILDFGIAKMRREFGDSAETKGLTRTGSMLGSPLYMSPEQARSVKNVDHRSDLWSLGVVLYQLLSGRTPCQHIDGLGDLILSLCNTPPTPVQEHAPWVPLEVAEFLDRALRIDPNERFQSAADMLAALGKLAPGGVDIREGMLVALGPEERARAATRFRRHDPAATTGDRSAPALAATALAPSSHASGSVSATTTGATLDGGRPGGSSGRRAGPVVAALAAAALLGGAAAYALTRSHPAAPPGPEVHAAPAASSIAPVAPTAPTVQVAPAESAVPSATPSAVPEASSAAPAAPTASARHPVPVAKAPAERPKAPAAPTAPKEPPRLDHSSFGDRK